MFLNEWPTFTWTSKVFKVPEPYDVVEMFAGKMAISRNYRKAGLRAAAMDIELNPQDDSRTAEELKGLMVSLWLT